MNLHDLPRYPGQCLARDISGNLYYVRATPEAVDNEKRLFASMQASGARPLGDQAQVADWQRGGLSFYQWCTNEQVPPRHCIALELEARAAGLSLAGAAFQPAGEKPPPATPTAPDPRKAQAILVPQQDTPMTLEDDAEPDDDEFPPHQPADGDIDTMRFSSSATLQDLQKAGIVHSGMSQDEFDSRLKRVKIADTHARVRLAAEAMEHGYFGRTPSDYRTRQVFPRTMSPNGDVPAEPIGGPSFSTATVPVGKAVNAQQVLREVRANLERIEAMLHPKGRTMNGKAWGC